MMFGNRMIIDAELEVLSDLHIGNGLTDEINRVDSDGQPQTMERALVQRDFRGKPLIPATTLKGGLKAAVRGLLEHELGELFGEISEHEAGRGRIGHFWLEPAMWLRGGGIVAEGDCLGPMDRCREDSYDRTRVAIDVERGAAADRLLFTEEIIGTGGRFSFQATFFLARERELSNEQERLLVKALAPLADGFAIGSDTRKGQGRIELDKNSVKVTFRRIDSATCVLLDQSDRDLQQRLIEGLKAEPETGAAGSGWQFELQADTPFISIADASATALDESAERKVAATLIRDGKPLIWPSSLIGALRARSEWLVACWRLQSGGDAGRFDGARKQPTQLKKAADASMLSSIDRLFGISGWRGELSVKQLEACQPAQRHAWTSVAIDRFTGGGRDGLLYKTETLLNPSFMVTLGHQPRVPMLDPEKMKADRSLIDLLVKDLEQNGIMLGHGAAKGFGWFKVDDVKRPEGIDP